MTTMNTVTERFSDVLSSGAGALQEVAATAVEQIESLPERVADITGSRQRRSRMPWLLLAAALVAVLGTAWWMRGRRQRTPDVDTGIDDGANPVRSHSDHAIAAATGQ